MELTNKIAIRKWISNNPQLSQDLSIKAEKNDIEHFNHSVYFLSLQTGISQEFIKQNIDQIRNWI